MATGQLRVVKNEDLLDYFSSMGIIRSCAFLRTKEQSFKRANHSVICPFANNSGDLTVKQITFAVRPEFD